MEIASATPCSPDSSGTPRGGIDRPRRRFVMPVCRAGVVGNFGDRTMRWKRFCTGLALLLAGIVGCKQVVYVTEDDLHKFQDLGLPAGLAYEPCIETQPVAKRSARPPSVLDPDRPIRYMSLAEAIAIALEQGTVGNQSTLIQNLFGSGVNYVQTSTDQGVSFLGAPSGRVGPSDSIRVLRLDPAIIGAGIESSLSKFDAVFSSSVSWN